MMMGLPLKNRKHNTHTARSSRKMEHTHARGRTQAHIMALADLEACAGQHQSYKRAANLVEAVHQLMEHFQQYKDVLKVSGLCDIQRDVQPQCAAVCRVFNDFTMNVEQHSSYKDVPRATFRVLDSLGTKDVIKFNAHLPLTPIHHVQVLSAFPLALLEVSHLFLHCLAGSPACQAA